MSSLVESARKLFTRGEGDLAARVESLDHAVSAARGRLDDGRLDEAAAIVEHARERLRLSADHTIVALAGATGSGKSSLFNNLTDLELAAVGVKRPTTSWALACAWGPVGASDILSWIGIPERHQVSRMSMLDTSSDDTHLQGLVLLDLPDHDSTEVSHHLEVDRLVGYADLLVWVLDPQKYADAAVHDRYLAPLASHSGVMLVVLNQIDQIPEAQRDAAVNDVRRLLEDDGLKDVPVLATSALTGEGLDDLRRALVTRIRDKQSATQRVSLDVDEAAQTLAEISGTQDARGISTGRRAALDDALTEAAGVATIVEAVQRSTAVRRRRTTGWPVTRMFSRMRKDPLADLGLDRDDAARHRAVDPPRTSRVQQAGVDVAVRDLCEDASAGLTAPWRAAVRHASISDTGTLHESIERAVGATDLGVDRRPAWVLLAGALQWLLLAAGVAGLGWLVALWVLGIGASSAPAAPTVSGAALPNLLLLGGLVGGLLLGVLSVVVAKRSAAATARSADSRLRRSISDVASAEVLAPIEAQLDAYDRTRAGLRGALRR